MALGLSSCQPFHRVAVPAAHPQLGAILEDHCRVTAVQGSDLDDAIQIHDGRSMNPQEAACPQTPLDSCERIAREPALRAGVKPDIVTLRADPVDVRVP